MPKKAFISADHGMAIIYFLQSDLVPSLLEAGVDVVVLTDDDTKDKIAAKFSALGGEPKGRLTFEGLRLKEANKYANTVQPRWQLSTNFLSNTKIGSFSISNFIFYNIFYYFFMFFF